MAEKKEIERLSARKAWLLQQNDSYRNNLRAESDNLREVCQLMERGHAFYRTATRLKAWMAPFSAFGIFRKKTLISGVMNRCLTGLKIWRRFRGT